MDSISLTHTKLPPNLRALRIAACPLDCVIRLTKGKIAIVDPWWWVKLNRHGWKAVLRKGGWYARKTTGKKGRWKYFYMHRIINNTPKGYDTHHKNRNTLDEREENLESKTPSRHKEIQRQSRITKYHERKPYAGCFDLPMV